jgi:hypothetical protein
MTHNSDEQQPKVLDTLELKTIELRLTAVKEATQRSRFVFIVMTVMSSTIIAGLWNGMLAWDRGWAFKDVNVNGPQEVVRNEWLRNLYVSASLLGVRVNINDLAVIGSLGLLVIMVWYFFSQRRENRTIVGLLRDCYQNKQIETIGKFVYEAIVQSIVFINMWGGDRPIRGLKEDSTTQPTELIRYVLRALTFLPPITIGLIILSDVSSLLKVSYLRPTTEILIVYLWREAPRELIKALAFDLFGLGAGLYLVRICILCSRFSYATAETIRKFRAEVFTGEEDATIEVSKNRLANLLNRLILKIVRLEHYPET